MNIDLKDLDNKISLAVQSQTKFKRIFRLVAGENLADCTPLRLEILGDLKGYMLGIGAEDLTEEILLDTLMIATADPNEEVTLCRPSSQLVAKVAGCKGKLISLDEQKSTVYGALEVEGYTEKAPESNDYEVEEEAEGVEEKVEEEELEGVEEEQEKEAEKEEKFSASEEEISRYYAQYCNGVIQELLKRYSTMFASGYEISKPAGLLTKDGIVKVSGSSRVVYEDSVSTTKMYELMRNSLGFIEVDTRSIVGIANIIYETYTSGSRDLLYFPNKMLEFAYGLCAPGGEKQESLNTYKRHADAANWSKYRDGELAKAIKLLVKKTTVGFISKSAVDGDYKSSEIMNALGDFLTYLQGCLSICVMLSEYKIGNINGEHDVASFKIRICDPESKLLNVNLTPRILADAFMGGVGKVPFTYQPRVDADTFVVEYSHEFNHDMAQATPLFAYKALESLKEQGMELSFDNLILGMAEDGSILRGGTHGVNLTKNLTHNISAGSQAGKGVMTLNILASGIASRKNIFYGDRKPDMASLFKYLAPNMPVINGGDIQQGYDSFNQWQGIQLGNVPDEVCVAFGLNPSWNELGDLVYMRLIKLVIGLLMVRGSGHTDACFGGENGILFVADEYSNFQRNYMSMISSLTSILPPITLEKAKKAVSEDKMTEAEFNRVYNNASYYALSYINSMMADIEYLKVKKDAGYDPLETARSDIFVIGQTLEKGMFDFEEFKETFSKSSASGRYKSVDAKGLTKGSFALGDQSIPFNLVNFKTADAFFGRNMDDGRDKYLAQTNKGSKANGRLDDKASNFAYLNSFSETTRRKIVHGTESENISIANRCTYFKPFLILNSSGMQDACVQKMFDRVQKNAGISPEELIAENPSYSDPSIINEGIGFIDYINASGVSDVRGTLEQSTSILNYIVGTVLKYPGNWFQFVTDFSPEWLFTIRDIVDAVETGNCGLYNPTTNPILQEYVEFNPERFGGSFEDDTTKSERAMDEFFYTDSTSEDYSDDSSMDNAEDERMGSAMGDFDAFSPEDEIDLDGEDDLYQNLEESGINETGFESDPDVNATSKRIQELLRELSALGVGVEVGDTSDSAEPINFQSTEKSEFGEEFEQIDYSDDISSLETLMTVITNDVIEKFGGLDRFTSFKVIGGSIVVNGYYYRCKIKDLFVRNIPYDIRRDINSGNISKLFNYKLLSSMPHIRDLEFDSTSFTYDYVSSQLGYGNSISVDKFFSDFRALQVLTIGKKRFDRNNYVQQSQGDDLFYKPKRASQIADASEMYLGKWSSSSWGFTKKLAKDKNCNKVAKVVGVVGGTTATVVTGAAKLGTKATRGIIKNVKIFGEGLKDLFNS